MSKSAHQTIGSALVIMPNNLGDVIMTMPALEGLKADHPECHVSFLVEEGFEAGLVQSACVDRLMRIPRKLIREALLGTDWKAGRNLLQGFIAEVNDREYDVCINFSQHDYMSPLASLVHAKKVAGRRFLREGTPAIPDLWSQYLYAIPFSRKSNRLHASDVFRRIAGVTKHGDRYPVVMSQEERDDGCGRLKKAGIDPLKHRIAVFQPGAALPSKKWLIGHFVHLGRMLISDGWRVVVSGAPSETGDALMIKTALGDGCLSLAGATTFRQAMGVLSHAQICVTPDTALMHAAAGLGVQTYALFGATSPVETGPYGDGHWVFSAGCADRPCFKVHCSELHCMKAITPDVVYRCITQGGPGECCGCDVYRTGLKPDSDYRLIPTGESSFSYYNENAAAMVLKGFGEYPVFPPASKTGVIESLLVQEIIKGMMGSLEMFLTKKDPVMIRRFEEGKTMLESCTGVGAFWTAALNLGLNSIPLIDVMEGVRQSVVVCKDASRRIQRAIVE